MRAGDEGGRPCHMEHSVTMTKTRISTWLGSAVATPDRARKRATARRLKRAIGDGRSASTPAKPDRIPARGTAVRGRRATNHSCCSVVTADEPAGAVNRRSKVGTPAQARKPSRDALQDTDERIRF